MVKAGDVYLFDYRNTHYLVFLTDDREFVIVNFSSIEGKNSKSIDNTCCFQKGELSFLSKDSFVVYREAKILSKNQVSTLINGRIESIKSSIDNNVLAKIQEGALKSDFTSPRVKSVLKQFLDSSGYHKQ